MQMPFRQYITPDIAKQYLELSDGNLVRINGKHGVIKNWVNELARIIQAGEWSCTPDPVAFHQNGHLANGHNRLSAIIKANQPVWMEVRYGLSDKEIAALDQGKKRSISDATRIPKKEAEILGFSLELATACRKPMAFQVVKLKDTTFGENVRRIISECGTSVRFFSSAPMNVACAYWLSKNVGDYPLIQYRALVLQKYDEQSNISKSLSAQVGKNIVHSGDKKTNFAKAMRVFNPENANLTKLYNTDYDGSVDKLKKLIIPLI
jgi:hypothetical protein